MPPRFRFRFDPQRVGMAKVLGPLETSVMEVLWEKGPSLVGEVQAALAGRRGLAYTTVLTILGRLTEKGLLQRTSVGNAHWYSPTMTKEEFANDVAAGVVDGLLETFSRPALAYFVRRLRRGDESFLKELEGLLKEAEGEQG